MGAREVITDKILVEDEDRILALYEAEKVLIIYKNLPSHLQRKLTRKQLEVILVGLDSGNTLYDVAKAAKLPNAAAIEVIHWVEKRGLI